MFFERPTPLSPDAIAESVGAELRWNGAASDLQIHTLASLTGAVSGSLSLLTSPRYVARLGETGASALLTTSALAASVPEGICVLVHDKPQFAFASVAARFYPAAMQPSAISSGSGISDKAHVEPSARIEAGATVEPFAVIGADVQIGAGTVVGPHAVIGAGVTVGRGSRIGASVTIQYAHVGDGVIIHPGARIGQDGFGFVPGERGLLKVPQIGRVIIQDGVEIGANVTIDRGALDDTVVGAGTKIDNQVQIGHNVRIGMACAIAAQAGMSGSVSVGDGVLVGGQVGFADHLKVGSGAHIAAKSGVMNDIPPGEKWAGAPAMPARQFFRVTAAVQRLARSVRNRGETDR